MKEIEILKKAAEMELDAITTYSKWSEELGESDTAYLLDHIIPDEIEHFDEIMRELHKLSDPRAREYFKEICKKVEGKPFAPDVCKLITAERYRYLLR